MTVFFFFHLRLCDDVIQGDQASAHGLLLLLFESDLDVSEDGDQSDDLLVQLQTLLTLQRGLRWKNVGRQSDTSNELLGCC